jgi:DNA-binding transcriptional LysR family regulator
MLTLPDFNRLKVFYCIYSSRSIVAAAKELNITRSAVSQHLKKLEAEIETQLFTRLHKRLAPTVAADRLFAILDPFIEQLQSGLQGIKRAKTHPSGLLRVGAPSEFGKAYLPGIFTAFRTIYPEVTFFLELGDPDVLLTGLMQGHLDYALVDVFLANRRFQGELGAYSIDPMVDEEVILACSRGYRDGVLNGDVSLANLLAHDFITYQPRAHALKGWFRHHFDKQAINPRVVLTVDSVQAVIEAVRQGMGMGVIASHLAHADLSAGRMVPIKSGRDEIINRISLVQLQDKVPSLTEKTFREFFKAAVQRAGVFKAFGG